MLLSACLSDFVLPGVSGGPLGDIMRRGIGALVFLNIEL